MNTKKQRLVCNECGAVIEIIKPCTCPNKNPHIHSNICCGKEMEPLTKKKRTHHK